MICKYYILGFAILLIWQQTLASEATGDSIGNNLSADSLSSTTPASTNNKEIKADKSCKFKGCQLILPGAMIGYGLFDLCIDNDFLRNLNLDTRHEISEHRIYKVQADDYLQYTSGVFFYGLKLCGVKTPHSYLEMSTALASSYLTMGILVTTIKYSTQIERPDGSSNNSFPSGHTATAFMLAELLRREYQESAPIVGILGYTIATGIGCFRVFNERHWVTDVVAGGGFGILSAAIGYWTLPYTSQWLWGEDKNKNMAVSLSPHFDGDGVGVNLRLSLK
ncbi:MAG: phosphatase PAP2 family protein [Paludibacteraceae bacterium]